MNEMRNGKMERWAYRCIWIPSQPGRPGLWPVGRTERGIGARSRWWPSAFRSGVGVAGSGPARPSGSRTAICSPKGGRHAAGSAVRTNHAAVSSDCCCSTSCVCIQLKANDKYLLDKMNWKHLNPLVKRQKQWPRGRDEWELKSIDRGP